MDIFCQIENQLIDQVLDQSENFYVLHDGYPLLEGHILIIPKQHVNCYLHLDSRIKKELNLIKDKFSRFLNKYYRQPVIFEHGLAGQTVPHAHLHLLPTNIRITDQILTIARLVKSPVVPYLYFEFNGKSQYFKPYKKVKPGLLHSIIYADLLNRPRQGIKRNKELKYWLLKVKNNLKRWKEEQQS